MKMHILTATILATSCGFAHAAATPDEINELGKSLTPFGAIKAGNAEGTIPEYTGGLEGPPSNYDTKDPGWRPNPFPEDEPVLRIDANNMAEHEDKLSPGVKALMQKYPTFFVNVYPTRRSIAYPQEVLDNTVKNASRCETKNGPLGIDTSNGCGFGIPFPIPANGLEAMWNMSAGAYRTAAFLMTNFRGQYVKPSGEIVMSYEANAYRYQPFYDTRYSEPESFYGYRYEYYSPTRLSGTNILVLDMLDDSERQAWTYSPATRRTRLSPDNAADTPVAPLGGSMTYDDDRMFSGKKDRYKWELVGKKEMYIPYNNFRYQYTDKADSECYGDAKLVPNHPKSECIRWELHRVWHVKATLLDGQRHIYHERDIFIDEDGWADGLADTYDQSGNIYRVNLQIGAPLYEVPATSITGNTLIDLVSGVYTTPAAANARIIPMDPLPKPMTTPGTLNRRVLRP